jgi:hypothetical protein
MAPKCAVGSRWRPVAVPGPHSFRRHIRRSRHSAPIRPARLHQDRTDTCAHVLAGTGERFLRGALAGRGGGSDDLAQGGGGNPNGVPDALRLIDRVVSQQVTGAG